jgi:hypothetical protein
MRPAFAVSAIVVSFLAVCADARPIDHEIARLRDEIIALDASLITAMSQAETTTGNDVELLHASIVAAQLETVDTAAAYREAKSLIAVLDNLRQDAIADLSLPPNYTPPDVSFTALAGASTDPESELASTYKHFEEEYRKAYAVFAARTLDIQKKIEMLIANRENISRDMVEQRLSIEQPLDQLSDKLKFMNYQFEQFSSIYASVLTAIRGTISSMARKVRE